jgi:hypothetical protein
MPSRSIPARNSVRFGDLIGQPVVAFAGGRKRDLVQSPEALVEVAADAVQLVHVARQQARVSRGLVAL